MKTFEEIQGERLIQKQLLFNIDKESLDNCFIVFYETTCKSFLVNGKGWTEEQRLEYVEKLIDYLDELYGTRRPVRKIVAQSGNIYFVGW